MIMGTRRHGQGGHLPPPSPWKCCKVFLVLQMLSKVSVDEVCMHYFQKMSSASSHHTLTGALPLDPVGGLPSFRPPYCPPLEKILRALMKMIFISHWCYLYMMFKRVGRVHLFCVVDTDSDL